MITYALESSTDLQCRLRRTTPKFDGIMTAPEKVAQLCTLNWRP